MLADSRGAVARQTRLIRARLPADNRDETSTRAIAGRSSHGQP